MQRKPLRGVSGVDVYLPPGLDGLIWMGTFRPPADLSASLSPTGGLSAFSRAYEQANLRYHAWRKRGPFLPVPLRDELPEQVLRRHVDNC